jgi:hypothetical protein
MAVFLGGAGGVAFSATYPTGASPRDVLTVDVDHDGWLDIVTANRAGDSVNVFLGRAEAGSFTSMRFDAGDGSRAVVSADFNHDGLWDLVTGNEYGASATLLLNHTILERAAFGFTRGTLPTAFGNSGDPLVGEFNHNGIPDLIVHDLNSAVAILDGATRVPLPAYITVGAIADFNADGHQDVAGRIWSGSTQIIRVMLGDGTGAFAQGPEFHIPVGGWFAAGDMDRNGRADIVLTQWNQTTQQSYIDVYLNHSSGWAAPIRFPLSSRWAISIQLADMNRDGMLDVVTSQFEPHMVHVMLGTGGGSLDAAKGFAVSGVRIRVRRRRQRGRRAGRRARGLGRDSGAPRFGNGRSRAGLAVSVRKHLDGPRGHEPGRTRRHRVDAQRPDRPWAWRRHLRRAGAFPLRDIGRRRRGPERGRAPRRHRGARGGVQQTRNGERRAEHRPDARLVDGLHLPVRRRGLRALGGGQRSGHARAHVRVARRRRQHPPERPAG